MIKPRLIKRDEKRGRSIDKAYEKLYELIGDNPLNLDKIVKGDEDFIQEVLEAFIEIEKAITSGEVYKMLEESYSIACADSDKACLILHSLLPAVNTPVITADEDSALFVANAWMTLVSGLMEEIKSLNAEIERSQTTINYLSDKLLKATEGIKTEQR